MACFSFFDAIKVRNALRPVPKPISKIFMVVLALSLCAAKLVFVF